MAMPPATPIITRPWSNHQPRNPTATTTTTTTTAAVPSLNGRLTAALDDSFKRLFAPLFNLISLLNPFPYFGSLANNIANVLGSPATHRTLLGTIIFGWLFALSLVISVVAYLSFYRSYVPQIGLSIPLWLQYGEGRVPYALVDLSHFANQIATDQPYNVAIRLTVPTTERNFELGNFMTRITITSPPPINATLHRASRHSSLIHQPFFARKLDSIKYLRTLFYFSPPQLVQHLDIGLFKEKIIHPGQKDRLGLATIHVGRDDAGELHVYDATLSFEASLDGLRAIMYYHPYFSFALFSTLFMTAEFASLLLTWALVLLRRNQAPAPEHRTIKKETPSALFSPPVDEYHSDLGRMSDDLSGSAVRRGMSEIDDLLGPDEEHRAVDHDNQDRNPSLTPVKVEDLDEDVLLGGSETTGASGSRSLGSDLDRTASSTSS